MAPDKLSSLLPKAMMTVQSPHTDAGIKAQRYEETVPTKPPIAVTVAPPRASSTDMHPALRRPTSGIEETDLRKRDSGLAPTESTVGREGSLMAGEKSHPSAPTTITLAHTSGPVSPEGPKTPNTIQSDSASIARIWTAGSGRKEAVSKIPGSRQSKSAGSDADFSPITTPIPTKSELELDFMDHIAFSKRGSVLLGGKRAVNRRSRSDVIAWRSSFKIPGPSTDSRMLSDELEKESQKVRSMYEIGNPLIWENGRLSTGENHCSVDDEAIMDEPELLGGRCADSTISDSLRPASSVTSRRPSTGKYEHELAGGIEDWEDVDGGDVDRYGFIMMRNPNGDQIGTEMRPPQRVSTVLQLASQAPRKRRGLVRTLSSSKSSRSVPRRVASRNISLRSLNTMETGASRRSSRSRSQPFRSAANRLPGNKDRRLMDEAGDMLTLPPGLADIAEEEEGGKAAESAKKKEWNRTEKWRKMARVVKSGREGAGMEFEFDVKHPKVIERTWKGIPDRWRAAAWHSFLSTSAKKRQGFTPDSEIVEEFYKLLQRSSRDDVQIDMDVPRTINSHIMFRRRYRGGQRLLFRVLHALSLYFPETGYVQGMASLAATLLCYYDEEKTFIMLVRLWQERGMSKLYEAGFPGLMAALDEFQKRWMNGHDVSKKLDEHGIGPTAYGVRWYLTLFNYSIPFPAQLRVWDVFMLLGDSDLSAPSRAEAPFRGGLDVLHAASAALIDGTRDILLDSDFENSMKVLTSWIPVKDEDLFMRVAKAEWKLHHAKW